MKIYSFSITRHSCQESKESRGREEFNGAHSWERDICKICNWVFLLNTLNIFVVALVSNSVREREGRGQWKHKFPIIIIKRIKLLQLFSIWHTINWNVLKIQKKAQHWWQWHDVSRFFFNYSLSGGFRWCIFMPRPAYILMQYHATSFMLCQ